MSDLLKKGFYLGLGAAISGKEKFEKKLDDLVAKREMTPAEAKSMLNSWISKGEGLDQEWSDQAKGKMQDRIKALGFVTKEEYELLEARLQRLENHLYKK